MHYKSRCSEGAILDVMSWVRGLHPVAQKYNPGMLQKHPLVIWTELCLLGDCCFETGTWHTLQTGNEHGTTILIKILSLYQFFHVTIQNKQLFLTSVSCPPWLCKRFISWILTFKICPNFFTAVQLEKACLLSPCAFTYLSSQTGWDQKTF